MPNSNGERLSEAAVESSLGPQSSEWSIGTRLGRYIICDRIATRQTANVYLAREQMEGGIERFVAIKQLQTHLLHDPHALDLFLDEARVGVHAQHPHVCHLFDFATLSGQPCIVLEYLVGESLGTVWQALQCDQTSQPYHAARIVRIISDACEGLHAVHEATEHHGGALNALHRDVTPDNLFVTYDGITKVLDFSIARATGQQHETLNGIVKGKSAYMSPEAVMGAGVDRRTDVWSLGVVLWELLTRQRLFKRDSDYETLRCVTESPVPTPSEVRADLPRLYDEIVMKALAHERSDRYATARDFAIALTGALARAGHAVGAAEIANWMDELIPGGRVHLRRQLQRAAQIRAATHMSFDPPSNDDASTTAYHPTGAITPSLKQRLLRTLAASRGTVGWGGVRPMSLGLAVTTLVGGAGALMMLWFAGRVPKLASVKGGTGPSVAATAASADLSDEAYRIQLVRDSKSPEGVRLRLVRATQAPVSRAKSASDE